MYINNMLAGFEVCCISCYLCYRVSYVVQSYVIVSMGHVVSITNSSNNSSGSSTTII